MGTLDINLPTKETIEGASIAELVWMIYGDPGIGKSTFLSRAYNGNKKPLFLYTDPGLRFIKALKKPILQWKQFKLIVDEFIKDPVKTKPFSIIVVDTSDLLYRMCRAEVCKRRNIEHISDEDWGKGYDLVKDEFEQSIAKLCSLGHERGFGVGFISHTKNIEIKGRTIKTSRVVPSLPKQAHEIIAPLCDIIGYCGFSTDKADKNAAGDMGRVLITEPSETIEAKDRTGMIPAKCPLDFDSVKEVFEGKGAEEVEEETTEEVEE